MGRWGLFSNRGRNEGRVNILYELWKTCHQFTVNIYHLRIKKVQLKVNECQPGKKYATWKQFFIPALQLKWCTVRIMIFQIFPAVFFLLNIVLYSQHTCSWHDKLIIILWILNRQAKISLCINIVCLFLFIVFVSFYIACFFFLFFSSFDECSCFKTFIHMLITLSTNNDKWLLHKLSC